MFWDIVKSAGLIVGGFVVVAVASQFLKILLSGGLQKGKLEELARMRDEAMIELESRDDISEKDKALTEASIARTYGRQLGEIDSRTNKILLYFGAVGGTLSILALIFRFYGKLTELFRFGSLDLFTTAAFAQDATTKGDLAPLFPYIALAVLCLMGLSFFLALGTILFLKDSKENQTRIRAADNIVKSFGGFFTGLATTLLH